MNRKFQFLTILTISALFSPIAVFAVSSPPGIPLLVYGEVTINGQAAPVDTEISAEIDSIKVATVNITDVGRYFIEVPDGKVNEGKMITFKVNGFADSHQLQCANIDTTPSINFNLAVTTILSSSPPTLPPTPSPTSGGGGGSGGGTTSPPPPVSKKGDITGDSKVDKYDFALLMANWGKTGTNTSDLNNDGKVDKYDFAILMANWTI